jgi:hypothetical protein
MIPSSEEQLVSQGRRSIVPALISLGLMVVLCIAAVKTLAWFSDPPSGPHRGEGPILSPISEDSPPNTLPPGVAEALGDAESLVIHLLGIRPQAENIPEAEDRAQQPKEAATFHGWPVFGSAHVTSRPSVRSIVRSVRQGVERYRNDPIGCFLPRHGVRVSLRDGRIIDLVICYRCQLMEVYFTPIAHEDLQAAGIELEAAQMNTLDDSRQLLNQALLTEGVDLKQEVVPWLPKP